MVIFLWPVSMEKTVVIAEEKSQLAAKLDAWLEENGYRVKTVADIEGIFNTLNLRGAIPVLLVDDRIADRCVSEDIATIKETFGDVPIIVATDSNDPEKEKRVRKEGVFYYHIKGAGMDELTTAISCAMKRAVELCWNVDHM
ncbi:MAG: response regulator [Desulfobacterales bacterium]|nr:response regulator [Desulfobacterales bacterium]